MTGSTLLQDLHSRGFTLLSGEKGLIVRPASRLTEEDRTAIHERKAELIGLLTRSESTPPADLNEKTETQNNVHLADELCPDCHGPLHFERGKKFLHVWCLKDGYDSWRALHGLKLKETDAPIFNRRNNRETSEISA